MNSEANEVIVVCGEQDVEQRSMNGFRLREIVYSDYVNYTDESTTINDNGHNGSYGSRTNVVSKPLVLKQPRFVMVQSGDRALAEKTAEIAGMEKLLREAREAEREAKKAFEAERETHEARIKANKLLERNVESLARDLGTEREGRRKLEGDIGKIRAAVGELKMKEIVGS